MHRIYYHRDMLSYLSALTVKAKYIFNHVSDYRLDAYNFIGSIPNEGSPEDTYTYVGFYPKDTGDNKNKTYLYPYKVSTTSSFKQHIYDGEGKFSNILVLTENYTGVTVWLDTRPENSSVSNLYSTLDKGLIGSSKPYYRALLQLLDRGIKSVKVGQGKNLLVQPNEGRLSGLDLVGFDKDYIRYKGITIMVIPQEANFMAYKLEEFGRGLDALVQVKFGLKSNSVVKYLIYNEEQADKVLEFLTTIGFGNFKGDNKTGYGTLPFNWKEIITTGLAEQKG